MYHIIECDKPQGMICKGSEIYLTFTVEIIRSLLSQIQILLKTHFLEKAYCSGGKKNGPIFSCFIEHYKPQRTTYNSPKRLFTNFFQVIRWFPEDLRVWSKICWKDLFTLEKSFGPFFFIIQKKQLSRVNAKRSTRSSDKSCASFKFVSIGPKRSLETNISKKATFTVTTDFDQLFSFYWVWQTSGNDL